MKKITVIISLIFVCKSCTIMEYHVIHEEELAKNIFLGTSSDGENYGIWLQKQEYDSLSIVGPKNVLVFKNPDSVKVFDNYILAYRGKKNFIMYNDSSCFNVKIKVTKKQIKINEIIKMLPPQAPAREK